MGSSSSKDKEASLPQSGKPENLPAPSQSPSPAIENSSENTPWYRSALNYLDTQYKAAKTYVSGGINEFSVMKTYQEVQHKYEIVKINIDKLDKEIKKFKDMRLYFFRGAMYGGVAGLVIGSFFAYRSKKILTIPKMTIGSGISIGFISACIPMTELQGIENNLYIKQKYGLSATDEYQRFWMRKYRENISKDN